jgi:hypothetical protein
MPAFLFWDEAVPVETSTEKLEEAAMRAEPVPEQIGEVAIQAEPSAM